MEQRSTSLRASATGTGKASRLIRDISDSLGKLPPQAPDLEQAVLGALMLEKNALTAVVEFLRSDHFYSEQHKEIYNAIVDLFKSSDPVVPTTGCQVSQTFHVTATDANGNTSAPCDITYVWTADIIKPTVTCPPGSIPLACNATPTCADAKAQVTAQDNCDANPTLGCVAGAVQLNGCQASQTFAVTATDACGNVSAPCDVTFTWTQDMTLPVITCPPDAIVECPAPITPATTGTATATDNCTPNPPVTSADGTPVEVTTSPASGWQFRTTDGSGGPGDTQTAEFVDGPASPPLGTGSARLAVGSNGDGAAEIRSTTYNGTLLSALTELRYHTYRTVDGSGDHRHL